MTEPLVHLPTPHRYARLLRFASILALIGLALIVWSILDPRPIPVVVAMSAGQAVGTLSLVLFLFVVVADVLRTHRLAVAIVKRFRRRSHQEQDGET